MNTKEGIRAMGMRRRRTTRGGLVKTSIQISPYQAEMLDRLSQAQGISISAVVGQAIDDKLRAPATIKELRRDAEPEAVAG